MAGENLQGLLTALVALLDVPNLHGAACWGHMRAVCGLCVSASCLPSRK